MKLKIHKLERGPMVLTGSKVLELIQDNHTPHIDLLVRESIQNSADAILTDKEFGKVVFTTGTFDKSIFADKFQLIEENIKSCVEEPTCDFLAIKDSNTCGLLGKPEESENGEPNNLYSLVYDVMNRKAGNCLGGSHGIGKTIYYRYGRGICIFYSKTFENGAYQEKLAGVLIQNETKETCLLGKNSSGIAYFGEISNNKPTPVYNKEDIVDFLNLFGISPFAENETGTMVIIPFFNKNMMLSNNINDDNELCYWKSNFENALDIAVQRWYFARVNNERFNGKYLKIAINNKKVELNKFFSTMQNLYNGSCEGCKSFSVEANRIQGVILGKFNYKVFDKNELGMKPPLNLPSPKYLTDSQCDVDESGLLFYLRKPGMVVNYDNSKFGNNYLVGEDKYLIGVFILNDEACFNGENIGGYLRKSEEANHKVWNDINSDEYPLLQAKKPFTLICSNIKKKLNDEFKQTKAVSLEGVNTVLQKKLGEKLLPPSGFGKGAEVNGGGSSGGGSSTLKEKKSKIDFLGMNSEGILTYAISVVMKNNESSFVELNVKVGGKSYSFEQWSKMNFEVPCQIVRIDIEELFIEKNKVNSPQNIPLDENFSRRRKKMIEGKEIYKIKGIVTNAGTPFGLGLGNICGKKLAAKVKLSIKPLDNKYMLGINVLFREASL